FLPLLACSPKTTGTISKSATALSNWQAVAAPDNSKPVARHEAAFVRVKDKAYLLGGRGIRPVSILDLKTNTWTQGTKPPIEIHHFQPVVWQDEILLLGAMTGKYPGETPLPNFIIYNPERDEWRTGPEIPEGRRRGGAGSVLQDGKIYLVCGIVDGHRGGHVPWLDVYDLKNNTWQQLPDAPRPRDHFQAVIHQDKLYSLAGRTTISSINPFAHTIGEVDVYDMKTNTWSTLPDTLPTHRAGNAALVLNNDVLVVGGESTAHQEAHNEVEALDTRTGTWRALSPLSRGRHGTGVFYYQQKLVIASGCGNRGGSPELNDLLEVQIQKD
ncbi:MAG: kelch repeat-containing protein, partial [Bacteroidota bacterium]